ncbi:MAG: M56 family metallopeptidase [Planctomycetaceae bacterium]
MFHAGWQTAVVAGVAFLLLRLTGRRFSSHWRYAVLLVVLLKFAAPPFLTMPVGLFSQSTTSRILFEPEVVRIVPLDVEDSPAAFSTVNSVSATVSETTTAAEPGQTVSRAPDESTGNDVTSTTSHWMLLFAAVYLSGLLLATGRIIRQFVMLQRIVNASSISGRGALSDEVAALARTLGMRSAPRVLITHDTDAPFATGVFRPVVVVPDCVIDGLQQDQLRTVIAHELVHIRRRDLMIGWLEVVLSAIWWFHPAMWWLRQSLRQAREECCDDVLVARNITAPERYCETLIVAASRQLSDVPEPVAMGFSSGEHPAARRIRRLMDTTRLRSDRLRKPALAVVVLMALILLPGMQPEKGPVTKTNLEGIFGWRNLPFQIDAEEEATVTELARIAQEIQSTRNNVRVFDEADTRERLEEISKERPEFFYAQQLLGTWHSRNGDPDEAARLLNAALKNAPVVLTQRFVFGDGNPAAGIEIPYISIECNRVQNRSLDPSLKLTFAGLVTDDNGEIHLPVYNTVYRLASYSSPTDYRVTASDTLGWFESKSHVGVLPEMMVWKPYSRPRDFTRTAAQTKLLKDATGSTTGQLDSGGNHYSLGSVARGQADGKFTIEDGSGKTLPASVRPLPEITNGPFMDHAVIDLASPKPETFLVGSVQVLDSQTKLPLGQFQSGAGVQQVDSRRFHAFSLWNPLPDTVDLVLGVYNYANNNFRADLLAHAGAEVRLDGVTITIPHLIAGYHNGWSSKAGFIGEPQEVTTTSEVQLVFVGKSQARFSVWVVLKDGQRWDLKGGGWFSTLVNSNGGGGTRIDAPLEEIDHFELRPYVTPDSIYFESIRLPIRHEPLDENVPVVHFPVNRVAREYVSDVLSPMQMHFRSEFGQAYSGIGGGQHGVSLMEKDKKQREPDDYATIVWTLNATVDFNVDAGFVVVAADTDPRDIGRRSSFSAQGGAKTVGVDIRKVPLQSVEEVQLRLSPK